MKTNHLQAVLLKVAYAGYQGHSIQQLLPLNARRELNPQEMEAVQQGEQQWIPKIFDSYGDSPAVNLADPKKQGLLWGAGLGIPAALMTAAGTGSAGAGLGAGVAAGGIAGLLAYFGRQQKNQDTTEIMRRLPENATMRDYHADPLLAEERMRSHQRMLAMQSSMQPSYGLRFNV